MFIVLEKIIYECGIKDYFEEGYNEESYCYSYSSIEEAIESGDFAPQILKQIVKGGTVSMQNLARSGTTRALKQEGVTFLCSVTL